MDETKINFKNKLTATLVCSIVFSLVYNLSAWYTSTLAYVPSFMFSFEKQMPFMPWTILPYLTSGLFFCTIFLFCKSKEQLTTLWKRLLFVILVAGIFYLIIPLKFSFVRTEITSKYLQFLFHLLETLDSPYNQAPSLHVSFALVFWTVFKNFKGWKRNIAAILLLSLGLSTLTTFQHHLTDVFGGAILAQLSFVLFPVKRNSFKLRNFHLANYYFLGGWIMGLISLLLYEFWSPYFLILLWISLMIFFIGYHYQKNNTRFLKDESGTIPLYKKIFYFPYLVIYWFSWRLLRNKKAIEILPKLYISSRLDKKEIQNSNFNENTLIYDFSAELEEDSTFKEKSQYFSFPLLDIGTFDTIEIEKIVSEISEKYKQLPQDGKILIHCTLGLTRSTFIGVLVARNILSLPLDKVVSKIKNIHKNAVIPTYLQEFFNKNI